jgi:hypothetical protein
MGGSHDETAAGELLAAALAYAASGLPVLPLAGKVPRNSNGLSGASTDAATVREWWTRWPEANVGIRTGAGSDLLVLDVDAPTGFAALKKLTDEHGALPETPQVVTGSGGRHHWFRYPLSLDARNTAGRLGAGLDTRGEGGYVVAPPSVHPETGKVYLWIRPRFARAEPPAWLSGGAARPKRAAAVADVIPEGKRNSELASLAGTMRRRGMSAAEVTPALEAVNSERCRPPLPRAEVAAIADGVARYEPAESLGKPAYEGPARALDDVVETFRRWLYLPDPGALYVALATVVANRLPGDPVWLLLVGASSSGKTEVLVSLGGLEEVEPAATLTEAALLSGVPRRDVAAGASGGLLKKIGEYGILTLKDFGSVLSMHRDARGAVLAALREVFDGSWDRPVGADGGRVLHWHGKLGLVAGVTTVVDRHHAVIDALGSRFAFYRIDVGERRKQAGQALKHRHRGRGMRQELRDAVAGLFAGLELPEQGGELSDEDESRIVGLADFVTVARSPVERDAYASREIELIPDAEAPARFAIMLASLLEGLRLIGIGGEEAWALVTKVALDSMPAQRRLLLEHLGAHERTTTREAATALGLPTTTARRTLEDLAAHGLVRRREGSKPGVADTWQLTPALAVPEMSGAPIRHLTPLTTTFRERA